MWKIILYERMQKKKAMSFSGEDVAQAIRKWMTEEVVNTPKIRTDLGKFFFGISTGTIGIFISLENFSDNPQIDKLLVTSLGIILVSAILALLMAIPDKWDLTSYTELYKVYNSHVKKVRIKIWTWFVVWVSGLVPGLWAVFQ